jgi:hypothetical protein
VLLVFIVKIVVVVINSIQCFFGKSYVVLFLVKHKQPPEKQNLNYSYDPLIVMLTKIKKRGDEGEIPTCFCHCQGV